MPEKLLTLKELSEYLQISEEKVTSLVEDRVILAYKVGGELLRFRKDQIDAIRTEIYSRVNKTDKIVISEARKKVKEKFKTSDGKRNDDTFRDRISDFFYFNDFYIISGVIVFILLLVIFRG